MFTGMVSESSRSLIDIKNPEGIAELRELAVSRLIPLVRLKRQVRDVQYSARLEEPGYLCNNRSLSILIRDARQHREKQHQRKRIRWQARRAACDH